MPAMLPYPQAPSRGTLFVLALVLLPAVIYTYALCCLPVHTDESEARSSENYLPLLKTSPRLGEVLDLILQSVIRLLDSHTTTMVGLTWGGFAARATQLMSAASQLGPRAVNQTYAAEGSAGIKALQGWYDSSTGLWTTTGWWNSANCLTALADYAIADPTDANTLGIASIMSTTFRQAQLNAVSVVKTISSTGMVHSSFTLEASVEKRAELMARGFKNFLNDYYDDEGWWALALIHSWDVTKNNDYLNMAKSIFADMQNGTDTTCGGGIWWSKDRGYKNAIANELYLSVAAALANRDSANKAKYQQIAVNQWSWFKASGMINSNNLINDGLNINSDGTCTNNGQNTWSYNQGVVLGGLVELAKATGNSSYLIQAVTIANAALTKLSDSNGIIHESGSCEPNCGGDGSQFKGIFMRNLHYLQVASPHDNFKNAIIKNADSIWSTDRNGSNQLGIQWNGPVTAGGGPNASTHSSALDVIVGAVAVA
ncbi:Six-hairpin glycosidase [Thozetella sp. PMI_491]|nr:Six-hairpin glycosidase [Thozetella sp. PMI_491]